jgi:hypothetical protein
MLKVLELKTRNSTYTVEQDPTGDVVLLSTTNPRFQDCVGYLGVQPQVGQPMFFYEEALDNGRFLRTSVVNTIDLISIRSTS